MSKTEDTTDKNSKQKNIRTKKPILNSSKLQNARVIQKHLVYVIGLSFNISSEKVI